MSQKQTDQPVPTLTRPENRFELHAIVYQYYRAQVPGKVVALLEPRYYGDDDRLTISDRGSQRTAHYDFFVRVRWGRKERECFETEHPESDLRLFQCLIDDHRKKLARHEKAMQDAMKL